MTHACELGIEADVVVRAVRAELSELELVRMRDHLDACAQCRATARGFERAKLAWTEAASEPAFVERARDARAMRRFAERSSARPRKAFFAGLSIGLAAAVAVAVLVGRREPPRVVTVAPAAPSPAAAAAPVRTAVPREIAPSGAVVVRTCAGCRSANGAVPSGVVLAPDERVEVPEHAELRLAFSVDEAIADPASGVSVDGPATVAPTADGVALDRGRARASSTRRALVRTPHVSTRSLTSAGAARWIVESGPSGTRIEVLSGRVEVASTAGRVLAALPAGGRMTVDAAGNVVRPAPAAPVADRWTAAQRALDAGDRSAAERELRALLAEGSADEHLAQRASFLLAELELARGDVAAARPRLDALVRHGEPAHEQLAEDAATLLARSYTNPADRARVWTSYLETNPSPARRERATDERARALRAAAALRP